MFRMFEKCLYHLDLTSSRFFISSPSSFSTGVDLLGLHPTWAIWSLLILFHLVLPSFFNFSPSDAMNLIHSSFALSTASLTILCCFQNSLRLATLLGLIIWLYTRFLNSIRGLRDSAFSRNQSGWIFLSRPTVSSPAFQIQLFQTSQLLSAVPSTSWGTSIRCFVTLSLYLSLYAESHYL